MSVDQSSQAITLVHEANFRLGDVEVWPSSRQVVVNGQAQVLEPRVMQVLVALARRRGEVVSRDDLVEQCWGGRIVGESAIDRCIAAVRRLGLSYGGFSLETIPRVGYRLNDAAGAAAPAPWPRTPLIGLAAALLLTAAAAGVWIWRQAQPPATPRVAVLPFRTTGEDPALRAVAQASADQVERAMAAQTPPVPPAADPRRAFLAIGGLVRRDGNRYVVSVNVRDVRSQATLWSGEAAGLANEVPLRAAVRATDKLACVLAPYRRGTSLDAESFALWLQVCDYMGATGQSGDPRAAAERLVARKPRLPEALAWAAMLEAPRGGTEEQVRQARARTYDDANRALKLDPSQAMAYIGLWIATPVYAWEEREAWLRKGLAASPDDPHLHMCLGNLLSDSGRLAEAREHYNRSVELGPTVARLLHNQAWFERQTGRLNEARLLEARAERLLGPEHSTVRILNTAAVIQDDPAEGARLLGDPARRSPGMDDLTIEAWRRYAAFKSGAGDSPADVLRAMHAALPQAERPEDYVLVLWALGDRDEAFRQLDRIAARRQGLNAYTRPLFVADAAPIRRDARFWPLMARLGLLPYWRKTGRWPDFCVGPEAEMNCPAAAAAAGV